MMYSFRYPIRIMAISIVLIITAFILIIYTYGDIAESLSIIETSRSIKNNPRSLESDILTLSNYRTKLQGQLKRIENMQYPDLEDFSAIASQNGLKLTGVDLKSQQGLAESKGRRYALTFSGRITAALDALDYIEKNFILVMESINLHQNRANEKLVDLNLTITIPD